MQEALVQRRARLRELLVALDEPVLAYSAGVVGCGREFFARVVAQGHEGVLAKDRASRYRPGQRSRAWRKLKPVGIVPCVIVGYRPGPEGSGRLLLATVQEGQLRRPGSRVVAGERSYSMMGPIIDIGLITKSYRDGVGMVLGRSTGGPFSVLIACVRCMKTVPFPVNSIEGTGTLIT